MSLNHYRAFDAIQNQLFRNFPDLTPTSNEGYRPQVNTLEQETAYLLDVDLPGISKESINIDVKDRELTISGERTLKSEHTKDDYLKIESMYGKFSRVFTLPDDADAENITATSNNGVLSVSISKLEEVDNHYTISIK